MDWRWWFHLLSSPRQGMTNLSRCFVLFALYFFFDKIYISKNIYIYLAMHYRYDYFMSLYIWYTFLGSVRVANELGAGNGRRARFAVIISVTESFIIGLIFSVLVVFLHDQIGWIFSSSETVIKAVTDLSVLLAFTILLNSVQPVLSGTLRNKINLFVIP